MQIAFRRVRRKTSPVRQYVRDFYSLKCQHIFGLYDSYQLSVISYQYQDSQDFSRIVRCPQLAL